MKKKTNLYYFSVEGWNERWYFEHLQKLINESDESICNVRFDIKIEKSPLSRKKSINIPLYGKQKLPVFHIVDYESNSPEHVAQFMNTLDELKIIKNKYTSFDYKLGYSNFAFELWLILHKKLAKASVMDRSNYVNNINELFGTVFTKMKENKSEKEFGKLLSQVSLDDVRCALHNSRKIRPYQEEIGNHSVEYKGFTYYKENPDLTVNECVEIIFKDCGIKWA